MEKVKVKKQTVKEAKIPDITSTSHYTPRKACEVFASRADFDGRLCSHFNRTAMWLHSGKLERRLMLNLMKRSKVAAVGGVMLFANVGIGTTVAADVAVPEAELEAPSPEYNRPPPRYYGQEPGESYMPPPGVYGYPSPRPRAYYSYSPPPVVILPAPYFLGRRFHPGYAIGPYGGRGYGAPMAGIYGRYGRGYRDYRRW
jgi:hypothetical protein